MIFTVTDKEALSLVRTIAPMFSTLNELVSYAPFRILLGAGRVSISSPYPREN